MVQLASRDGVVSKNYEYDAFGNERSAAPNDTNPFRYSGEYLDLETNTYYLRARYYNPTTGRFLQEDPIRSKLNWYTYCSNSPIMFIDPTGLIDDTNALILSQYLYDQGMRVVVRGGKQYYDYSQYIRNMTGLRDLKFLDVPYLSDVKSVSQMSYAELFEHYKDFSPLMYGESAGKSLGLTTGDQLALIAWNKMTPEDVMMFFQGFSNGRSFVDTLGLLGGVLGSGKTTSQEACFVKGTIIATENGNTPIEQIQTGDLVYSANPETSDKGLKRVVQTFIRQTNKLVHINVDGQKITTTPEHPFYVPQKGWISAIQLRAGDKLVLQSDKVVIIEQVQHEILETPVTVYNFEVEDWHTYYVSVSSVLVHNACSADFTKHSVYNDLRNKLGEKGADAFMTAMNKGLVGPQGQNGIKMLSGNGVKIGDTWYQYEVKVFDKAYANYRLYGNYNKDLGRIEFTQFDKAQH